MADLISRQAAIDAMSVINDSICEQQAIDALCELPSAQPERKTGKWIHDGYDFPHGNDWIHCSVCGKRGINVPADKSKYCPNCGARMVQEGEDNERA